MASGCFIKMRNTVRLASANIDCRNSSRAMFVGDFSTSTDLNLCRHAMRRCERPKQLSCTLIFFSFSFLFRRWDVRVPPSSPFQPQPPFGGRRQQRRIGRNVCFGMATKFKTTNEGPIVKNVLQVLSFIFGDTRIMKSLRGMLTQVRACAERHRLGKQNQQNARPANNF